MKNGTKSIHIHYLSMFEFRSLIESSETNWQRFFFFFLIFTGASTKKNVNLVSEPTKTPFNILKFIFYDTKKYYYEVIRHYYYFIEYKKM